MVRFNYHAVKTQRYSITENGIPIVVLVLRDGGGGCILDPDWSKVTSVTGTIKSINGKSSLWIQLSLRMIMTKVDK